MDGGIGAIFFGPVHLEIKTKLDYVKFLVLMLC
jgi:hypothetical protein